MAKKPTISIASAMTSNSPAAAAFMQAAPDAPKPAKAKKTTKSDDMVRINFDYDANDYKQLKFLAVEQGTTVTQLLRDFIDGIIKK